jgi:hypothetical protein
MLIKENKYQYNDDHYIDYLIYTKLTYKNILYIFLQIK